jgi:hypothetical protein
MKRELAQGSARDIGQASRKCRRISCRSDGVEANVQRRTGASIPAMRRTRADGIRRACTAMDNPSQGCNTCSNPVGSAT